ncbi:MAG: hypothetical protein IPK07_04040 [Deltaproteobacteria bacterium]|jgi:hypothetical protein|nr:hypothetical protein [Deltaproteobacteria bacterium]
MTASVTEVDRPRSRGPSAALGAAVLSLVLEIGCSNTAMQLAAQEAVDRATKAELETEALQPSRSDQMLYRMPLNQARDALAGGRDEEAKRLADKAYQSAVEVRDRRLQAKKAIGTRMTEVETLAQIALKDPDPSLDKEALFREVDKRYASAKKKLAALDYEGSLDDADEALTMLKRRTQLFRKSRAIQVTPPTDESVVAPSTEPAPSAPEVETGAENRPGNDGGSFMDRLRRAATKSGTGAPQ